MVKREDEQPRVDESVMTALRQIRISAAPDFSTRADLYDVPVSLKKPRPQFGSASGSIQMSDDFDEAMQDFAEYTE